MPESMTERMTDDTLRDELIHLTSDLIRFESTVDNPDALAAVMEYVAAYLEAIPGLLLHRSEAQGKPAIVATLHDTHTPALMLNGHLDVVPAEAHQFEPQVRDGRIYGRGSYDMKGSVAVLLRLLKDLAARDPRPDVGVQFVSDEEIGGKHGTARLLREGWRCGCFIAAEPTGMHICNQQKGLVWLKLRLPGVPAHASRPWEGENPLLQLGSGLAALGRRFPTPQQAVWASTVTPTRVQSGGSMAPNQVPPDITLHCDIRFIPDDTEDALVAAVQECFPTAEIVTQKMGKALFTAPETPVIQQLAATIARVRGEPATFYSEHFSSDARFYSAAGIPAVCLGPVGAGLHASDEWVAIESLGEVYEVLWLTAGSG